MNCQNCGRLIGNLERPIKWKGHLVCGQCYQQLNIGQQQQPKSFRLSSGSGKQLAGCSGCLAVLIFLALIVVGIVTVSSYVDRPLTPEQKARKAQQAEADRIEAEANEAKAKAEEKASKEAEEKQNAVAIEATDAFIKSGFITQVDYERRRVRVQLLLWLSLNATEKENITLALAYRIRSKVGYAEVTVTSNDNDQELASYGPFAGMKISR